MASVSATCIRFATPVETSLRTNSQTVGRSSGLVSLGWRSTRGFRAGRLQICAAKPETVEKVKEIVKKQLALSAETVLTPQTKFTELGADSLDTVEIVMGLEEQFDISVEEENSESITTIQEAADLIDKLCGKDGGDDKPDPEPTSSSEKVTTE